MGMAGMLASLRLPLVGRHHSGIDDARNIAAIVKALAERGGSALINETTWVRPNEHRFYRTHSGGLLQKGEGGAAAEAAVGTVCDPGSGLCLEGSAESQGSEGRSTDLSTGPQLLSGLSGSGLRQPGSKLEKDQPPVQLKDRPNKQPTHRKPSAVESAVCSNF
jgi:hypothetical protein